MKGREYQLALSGKKTLFRPKEPTVRFVKRSVIEHTEECDDFEKIAYIPQLIYREPKDVSYSLDGINWYHTDLYGNKALEINAPSKDGNVVLGFTSNTLLMLDIDYQAEETVLEFAEKYAKFHRLGSWVVLKTSEDYLTDFFGNRLGKYCIIFGRPICWEEIRWHIKEARRLGMIERAFTKLREFGYITIRVNSKNDRTPPPKIVKFFANGDMRGIRDYVQFLNRYRSLGFADTFQTKKKR